MPRAAATDHLYTVELWDPAEQHVMETIATANVFKVARAAFDAAVRSYPGQPITMRQGIRVVLRA